MLFQSFQFCAEAEGLKYDTTSRDQVMASFKVILDKGEFNRGARHTESCKWLALPLPIHNNMVISMLSIWSPCDIIHLRDNRNLSRKASWMGRRCIRSRRWLTSCFPHCCPYVVILKGMELRGTSWSQERIFLSYKIFRVQLCRGNWQKEKIWIVVFKGMCVFNWTYKRLGYFASLVRKLKLLTWSSFTETATN